MNSDSQNKLYSENNYLKAIQNELSCEEKEKCVSAEEHRAIVENKLNELMKKASFK